MDGIALVRLALNIITERLLVVFILLLSFFLCCWVMYDPNWERLAVSFFFSMFSYLVVNSKERYKNESKAESSGE